MLMEFTDDLICSRVYLWGRCTGMEVGRQTESGFRGRSRIAAIDYKCLNLKFRKTGKRFS